MGAESRRGDKNWDVYEEDIEKRCNICSKGKIIERYVVASHEKVLRVERDFIERVKECEYCNA